MEIHNIPLLRDPVMIVAFTGWNDAAEGASGALEHLLSAWREKDDDVVPQLIADVEAEDFYDFQVNRPQVSIDDSSIRSITWPGTQVFGLAIPSMKRDLVIVTGVEPSMRWKKFTSDLLDLADDLEVSLVITLGSLLADSPHTRPITVTGTGGHPNAFELQAHQPSVPFPEVRSMTSTFRACRTHIGWHGATESLLAKQLLDHPWTNLRQFGSPNRQLALPTCMRKRCKTLAHILVGQLSPLEG